MQFSSTYQPEEKWTEEKALELGNELIDWLKDKEEDQNNIFYEEFIVMYKDLYPELIAYLSNKFDSFLKLIKKAKKIQEMKLIKYGVNNKLQPAMTIFVLKNHHEYKDKKELEHSGEINSNLSELSTEELLKRAEAVKNLKDSE